MNNNQGIWKTAAIVSSALFMLSLLILGTLIILRREKAQDTPETNTKTSAVGDLSGLKAKLSEASFPTYLPKSLPEGYVLQENSLANGTGFISFSISKDNGAQLVVTQQPRPKLVEEVTHTKDLYSPMGTAYIANLNGRYAGFLYTEETLLIVTTAANISDSQISKDIEAYILDLRAL